MRRYTIFSVSEARRNYTDPIRKTLRENGWAELYTRCVDARRSNDVELEIALRGIKVNPVKPLTRGEIGVWMTVLNGVQNAPVVTLEDDAIMGTEFYAGFETALAELPEDADFFSLFIPRDSDHLFTEEYNIGHSRVCRAYQEYGGVSMYITLSGARRIMQLVDRDGILRQWDNQLYDYAKAGELNGYTSMPSVSDLVYISGSEQTTVHNTERFGG